MTRWLLLGAMLVYAGLGVAGVVISGQPEWSANVYLRSGAFASGSPWMILLPVTALPLLATGVAAEAMCLWRLPRILDGRLNRRVACVVAGVFCGVLGAGIAALALVLLEESKMSESVIIGMSAASATVLLLMFSPAQKRGRCHQCGYDLGGITPQTAGRCAECGTRVVGV